MARPGSIVRSGETISSTSYSRRAGGKGANQAVSAARAGAKVDFAGAVGPDGAWLQAELQGYGVDTDHLLRDEKVKSDNGRHVMRPVVLSLADFLTGRRPPDAPSFSRVVFAQA